jgi:DNA polymerase-3 subunit delta
VLRGDDDIEKAELAGQFVEAVDEGLRAFNVDRLYGGEAAVDEVIDIANTLPMMAPRRLVVILEGEKLLVPKRESKAADAAQQRLEAFLAAPPPHASIIFVCSSLDERRRVVKLLLKEAQVVNCGAIADAAEAERWVKARAAREAVTFEPAAVRALIERAGLDIARLRSGFDRLALYAMGQPAITARDVQEVVTAGPDAQEHFGIANAIGNGDARAAVRQLGAALDSGAAAFFVLGQIRTAAERLPASRIPAAIDALLRTDVALKSSGGVNRSQLERLLLERLVVELCEGHRPRVKGQR